MNKQIKALANPKGPQRHNSGFNNANNNEPCDKAKASENLFVPMQNGAISVSAKKMEEIKKAIFAAMKIGG